mgnify:FL=1
MSELSGLYIPELRLRKGIAVRDSYGRDINYLRISLTDRCNLRCRYCMPEDLSLLPMSKILTYEEILLICEQAVALGITRFKVTGGEPLVRKGCASFCRSLRQLPGVEQVTLTTNGVLLEENLPALVEAGVAAINISLDTLQPERFEQITGRPYLEQVLRGIRASAAAAEIRTKLNVVLQKGWNDDECQTLAELARKHPLDVRFIEMMPIGFGKETEGISNEEVLRRLRETYGTVTPDDAIHGNGPAVYYRIPGFAGSIGLISAMHGKFCGSCNRIRMTSTGEVKACLCYEDSHSVREAARAGDRAAVRRILEDVISSKPAEHCFEEWSQITEKKKMSKIGG